MTISSGSCSSSSPFFSKRASVVNRGMLVSFFAGPSVEATIGVIFGFVLQFNTHPLLIILDAILASLGLVALGVFQLCLHCSRCKCKLSVIKVWAVFLEANTMCDAGLWITCWRTFDVLFPLFPSLLSGKHRSNLFCCPIRMA